jgi:hypothetical protein
MYIFVYCISPLVRGFSCTFARLHMYYIRGLWPLWNTTCLFVTWYQSGLGSYAHRTHRPRDCHRPSFSLPRPAVGLLFLCFPCPAGSPACWCRPDRPPAACLDRPAAACWYPGSATCQIGCGRPRPTSWPDRPRRPDRPRSATLPDRPRSATLASPGFWWRWKPPGTRHAQVL